MRDRYQRCVADLIANIDMKSGQIVSEASVRIPVIDGCLVAFVLAACRTHSKDCITTWSSKSVVLEKLENSDSGWVFRCVRVHQIDRGGSPYGSNDLACYG